MLREIGILLTSIVVAGRTASAFAASIGTIKLNQEIEAFQILGLRPLQRLHMYLQKLSPTVRWACFTVSAGVFLIEESTCCIYFLLGHAILIWDILF